MCFGSGWLGFRLTKMATKTDKPSKRWKLGTCTSTSTSRLLRRKRVDPGKGRKTSWLRFWIHSLHRFCQLTRAWTKLISLAATDTDQELAHLSLSDLVLLRLEKRSNPQYSSLEEFFQIRRSCWLVEQINGDFYCDCPIGIKGHLCKLGMAMWLRVMRIDAHMRICGCDAEDKICMRIVGKKTRLKIEKNWPKNG